MWYAIVKYSFVIETIEKNYRGADMFSKYNYVYQVYKERSFTRAAEKLFISQPSLSVAIKNIEKKLGADLFERMGNTVRLTDVGKEYIKTAEQIITAEKEFLNRINDINDLKTGKIVVGGTNYLSSYVLPRVINQFNRLYPDIDVELVEANSYNLGNMLDNEQIDIIIDSFDENAADYQSFFLASEDILLCVPKDRKINEKLKKFQIEPESIYKGSISLKDVEAVSIKIFKDENFILLKKGNDMYKRAMKFFDGENIEPNVTYRVDQLNISYALADSGIGLCFITDTFLKYGRGSDNVFLYKVRNEQYSRNLYIAHKKNKYCTKAMAEFIKITKEILGDNNTYNKERLL